MLEVAQMDDDEHVVGCKMIYELNPNHHVVYIFENGKGVRVNITDAGIDINQVAITENGPLLLTKVD